MSAGEIKDEILCARGAVAIREVIRDIPEAGWNTRTPIHAVTRCETLLIAEIVVELDIHLVGFVLVDALPEPVVHVRKRETIRRRLGVIREHFLSDFALHRWRHDVA